MGVDFKITRNNLVMVEEVKTCHMMMLEEA